MASTDEILLGIFKDLSCDDFEEFKWILQKPKILLNFPAIPKCRLENANRLQTVDLMVQTYNTETIEVTRMVLDKINRRDLLEPISEPKASRKPDRPETEEDLDQSSASGEALQPGPKASDKALKDPGGEQRLKRDDLKKYSCELTLDTNTVCRYLKLSDKNRKVTCVREEQPYPDHPERFYLCQVLCRDGLTGRRYWEVEWRGRVTISVSYRGISRKRSSDDCRFGGNDQSWKLTCSDGDDDRVPRGYTVWHNKIETLIPSSSVSHRVAVYVDCPAGSLSFYSVSSDSLIHLYTFNTTFTEPLYPGFMFGLDSSVSLCDV